MNKQELIKKYEDLFEKLYVFPIVTINGVVEDLKQLDEPQLIKFKDVITRIKGFDSGTQKVWLDEILNELGSDYGTLKYKAGYEQGKFDGTMEREKVVVQQFVADWIEYCKNTGLTLKQALMLGEVYFYSYANQEDFTKLKEFLKVENNQDLFACAWLFGYTVENEKEKQYEVILCNGQSLKTVYRQGGDHLDFEKVYGDLERFTRKQLEDAGFGWMFDCPGMEVREVE